MRSTWHLRFVCGIERWSGSNAAPLTLLDIGRASFAALAGSSMDGVDSIKCRSSVQSTHEGETCGSAQIGSSVQTPHAAAHTHSWVPSHHHQPWRFVRSQARGLCTGTIRDKQQDGSSQQDAAAAAKEELITDIAASLAAIGLEPGLDCVVGDGLATIDVALFVEGHQIAIDVQPLSSSGSSSSSSSSAGTPLAYATPQRQFSQALVHRRVLESYGWSILAVPEEEWRQLSNDELRRRYLAHVINDHLEAKTEGGSGHGHHHHHSGCGCSAGAKH